MPSRFLSRDRVYSVFPLISLVLIDDFYLRWGFQPIFYTVTNTLLTPRLFSIKCSKAVQIWVHENLLFPIRYSSTHTPSFSRLNIYYSFPVWVCHLVFFSAKIVWLKFALSSLWWSCFSSSSSWSTSWPIQVKPK